MQGMMPPSLFCMEKDPASTGDVAGHVKPEAHASLTEFSIA